MASVALKPVPHVVLKRVQATRSRAMFEYSLDHESDVVLTVYDIAGRRVAWLEDSRQSAGVHSLNWDTEGLPRGVYFFRLRVGSTDTFGRLALVR